jgi:hypothetical protein
MIDHIPSQTLAHLYTCWREPVHFDASTMPEHTVDPSLIEITNDPLPPKKIIQSKYADIFKRMRFGQRIKCPPEAVDAVRAALEKHLKTMDSKAIVKSVKNYGDGYGGVRAILSGEPAATPAPQKNPVIKTQLRPIASAAKAGK